MRMVYTTEQLQAMSEKEIVDLIERDAIREVLVRRIQRDNDQDKQISLITRLLIAALFFAVLAFGQSVWNGIRLNNAKNRDRMETQVLLENLKVINRENPKQ